jgi:hypothetical protein
LSGAQTRRSTASCFASVLWAAQEKTRRPTIRWSLASPRRLAPPAGNRRLLGSARRSVQKMNETTYLKMKEGGASATVVYQQLRADGYNPVESVRLIEVLYDMPVLKAKEIMINFEHGVSLTEYQEKILTEFLAGGDEEGHK